jgi:hypothetical protein
MGCASIATRYVIPAIKELEDEFELTAVSSRAKEKQRNSPMNLIVMLLPATRICFREMILI